MTTLRRRPATPALAFLFLILAASPSAQAMDNQPQRTNVMLDGGLSVDQIKNALRHTKFSTGLTDEAVLESIARSNTVYKVDAQKAYQACADMGLVPKKMAFAVLFVKSADISIEPQHYIQYCRPSKDLLVFNLSQYEQLPPEERVPHLTELMSREPVPLNREAQLLTYGYQTTRKMFAADAAIVQDAGKAAEAMQAIVKNPSQVCAMFQLPPQDFVHLNYRGIAPDHAVTLFDMRTGWEVRVMVDAQGRLVQPPAKLKD
jgi:hypothetical protein